MVSFSCEGCNETMIKKKVAPHIQWCRSSVTCIDCSQTFDGQSFKQHNQCMTEDQKYQGKLYKPKPAKGGVASGEAKVSKSVENTEHKKDTANVNSSEDRKEKKAKKQPSKFAEDVKISEVPVRVTKSRSLKKVLKSLRKEHKLKESDLSDKITVTPDGKLILNTE